MLPLHAAVGALRSIDRLQTRPLTRICKAKSCLVRFLLVKHDRPLSQRFGAHFVHPLCISTDFLSMFRFWIRVGKEARNAARVRSAVLAAVWLATVVYAVIRFKKRGLWFLVGTPLIAFWFFVLFLIAWGCAHNLRACP